LSPYLFLKIFGRTNVLLIVNNVNRKDILFYKNFMTSEYKKHHISAVRNKKSPLICDEKGFKKELINYPAD